MAGEGRVVAIFEQYVYTVYELVDGSWTKVGQDIEAAGLTNSSDLAALASWRIGQSAALSDNGQTIAIPNIVKVYRLTNGTKWDEVGHGMPLGESDGERSVSLSRDGNVLAVGTVQKKDSTKPSSVEVLVEFVGDK